MSTIRAAAVATQMIGVLWALLALIYATDQGAFEDFAVGMLVVLAGVVIYRAAAAAEERR